MKAARGPLFAFAAFGAYWGAWGVLVPDIKNQVDASVTQLGVAFLAVAVAALPAMLVTGRIVDRVGPTIMPLTLILFGASVILPALAGSVWQLALALLLVGASSGAVDVVINVAATNVETSGGPRVMQVAHALYSAGFLVAAVTVGLARGAGAGPFPVLVGVCGLVLAAAARTGDIPRPTRPHRNGHSPFRAGSSSSGCSAGSRSSSRAGSRTGARSFSRPSWARRRPSAGSAPGASPPRWSRGVCSASGWSCGWVTEDS